jgi:hypothetical protein
MSFNWFCPLASTKMTQYTVSFSLGAKQGIRGCWKKKLQLQVQVPRLSFLTIEKFSTNATWKHQLLGLLARLVIIISLDTVFSLVNRLATGAPYCAPVEKEDTMYLAILFVYTHM